jgi:hypothetical protein
VLPPFQNYSILNPAGQGIALHLIDDGDRGYCASVPLCQRTLSKMEETIVVEAPFKINHRSLEVRAGIKQQ